MWPPSSVNHRRPVSAAYMFLRFYTEFYGRVSSSAPAGYTPAVIGTRTEMKLSADVVQVSQKSNPREMLCQLSRIQDLNFLILTAHFISVLYAWTFPLLFPPSLLCFFSPEEDLFIPQVFHVCVDSLTFISALSFQEFKSILDFHYDYNSLYWGDDC